MEIYKYAIGMHIQFFIRVKAIKLSLGKTKCILHVHFLKKKMCKILSIFTVRINTLKSSILWLPKKCDVGIWNFKLNWFFMIFLS